MSERGAPVVAVADPNTDPNADPDTDPDTTAAAKRRRRILLTCLIGMFSTAFPATILTISVKAISVDLHSVPTTITWVTTAPLLAGAVATPVLGRLGDLRGQKRIFLFGLILAGVFAFLAGIAWNAASLIVFRTISQIGAAGTIPSTFAILFRCFPADERVRATSLASGVLASAAVIGVIIGGPMVDLFGWRPIFLIQAAITAASLLAAVMVLPKDDDGHTRRRIDLPGAAALAAATFTLTFGINRLGVWGPTLVPILSLVAFPFATVLLIVIERRATAPLLPLRVLSARNTQVVSGVSFLVGASWMGNLVITPLLLQSVMGLSAGITSLISVPRAGFVMLAAPIAGRLGARYGERKIVIYACAGLCAVLALMALGASLTMVAIITIALPLTGWAFGHSYPGLVSAMGHSVAPEDFGLATSLQQTSTQVGQVVGVGLFTALAANSVTAGPFVLVYLLSAGCALIATVLALGIRDRVLPSQTPVDDDAQAAGAAISEAEVTTLGGS
jgi:MFS family permease